MKEVASLLPSKEDIIRILDQGKPITEAHLDEIYPRGRARAGGVLVVKDEHGRIIATQEVDKRDEASVRKFLEWLHSLGLKIRTFYCDTCQTYRKVIPEVFKGVHLQLDYFHIIQNVWRHLWKYFVARRKQIKANAEKVGTPWYKAKLKALAESLWANRHIVFKAERNLTDEDRTKLVEVCEADRKVKSIRAFLRGVWHIFEDSKDEADARRALDELKAQGNRAESIHHERAIKFLEGTLDEATTFLREDGVKRNSLSESGMRTLRRLEAEHDGFRTEDSREDFLRIFQAVKYLGWSVHGPPAVTPEPPA